MTRKILRLFLLVGFLFALAGCGGTSPASTESSLPVTSATQQEESSAGTADAETGSPTSDGGENQEEPVENTILVAYFSATGTTEQIAQQAAEILGADIYEIVPEEPYTEADLAYYTGGRADQEQDDPAARPAISGGVADMGQYETILLGYPIWHGQAPRIVSTFLEDYDFSGKTIIPFCTSHSSGVGSSADNLHALCPDTVTWTDGTRFPGGTSREELEAWLQNQGF